MTGATEVVAAVARDFPEVTTAGPGLWLVGGAVRDALLGRSSPDVDFAGPAAGAKAAAFARATGGRLVPLGRERFPTWRVVVEGRVYDFSDLTGEDIAADLGRRDFTINALAAPLEGGGSLEDPFGGIADLEARVVRMLSRRNLVEDPLRVLKAVRMAAALGFDVDPATREACRELAAELRRVAPERIGAELEIIFGSADLRRAADLLRDTGIDRVVFGRPIPEALAGAGGDPVVAWAAIFRGADPGALRTVAAELRWPS
ncbi:MAG: hypothetical protein ACRD2J_14400, partial [Thermoanaerobaculia bacterium]